MRAHLSADPSEERLHGAGDDALAAAPEGVGGAQGVRLAGTRLACSTQNVGLTVKILNPKNVGFTV